MNMTYPLLQVGKGRRRHVERPDERPLCERGKWARHPHSDLTRRGYGEPTCELCRRVLDGRWPS
jgi:hypothetical protein